MAGNFVTPLMNELFDNYLGRGGIFSAEFRDSVMAIYFSDQSDMSKSRKRLHSLTDSHRFLSEEFRQFILDAFEEYFVYRENREKQKLAAAVG